MDDRDFVAALYVLGALVTVAGVLTAYLQAAKQKRRLDAIANLNRSDDEPDFVDSFEDVLAGADDKVARQVAARSAREAELERALSIEGIKDRPPTINDMRLPVSYWSKRSAVADTVSSFKTGGLVALLGLGLSTIASVWSLYL